MQQMRDAGVVRVLRPEHRLRFDLPIRLPHGLDVQNGQHHPLGIPQGQLLALPYALRDLRGDVEHDRHGPERPVGETHVFQDGLVVALAEEAGKRGEPAVHEQLEITELARGQVPGRPFDRLGLELRLAGVVNDEVDKRAAVRRDEVVGHGLR